MTILNVSVTHGAAVLVQDSLLSELTPTGRPLATVEKIHTDHAHRLAIGTAGNVLACRLWIERIAALGADLAGIDDQAPDVLRELAHEHPDLFAGFLAAHIGLDRQGNPAGIAYSVGVSKPDGTAAAPDFAAVQLDAGNGHLTCPGIGRDDHPDLTPLWDAAQEGRELPEFHRQLAQYQLAAVRSSPYPRCIGGPLRRATVTRNGVRIETIDVLPVPGVIARPRAHNVGQLFRLWREAA